MPRPNIPPGSQSALFASQTQQAYLVLLTISTDSQTYYITSDAVDTVFNGQTYLPFPFQLVLPSNQQDTITRARISLDNVSRALINDIRSQSTPIGFQIDVVASDDILAGLPSATFTDFTLTEVTYNQLVIEGTISMEDYLAEPFPQDLMSQNVLPGLFGVGIADCPVSGSSPGTNEFNDTFTPITSGVTENLDNHVPELSPLTEIPYWYGNAGIFRVDDNFESFSGSGICHAIARPYNWMCTVTQHGIAGSKRIDTAVGYSTNGTGTPPVDNREMVVLIRAIGGTSEDIADTRPALALIIEYSGSGSGGNWTSRIEEYTDDTTRTIIDNVSIDPITFWDVFKTIEILDDGTDVQVTLEGKGIIHTVSSTFQQGSEWSGIGAAEAPNETGLANVCFNNFEVTSVV